MRNFMMQAKGALGVALGLFASACSGAASSVVNGQGESPSRGAVEAPPSEDGPQAVTPPTGGGKHEAEGAQQSLVLPRDERFLAKPLPRLDVGRYESMRETSRITVGRSHLFRVDLLSSGKLIALSDDEAQVRVYDPLTKKLLGQHAVAGFSQFKTGGLLAWPGDETFVVGGAEGIALYDAHTGTLIQALDARPVTDLRFSPDKRILMAVGSGDRDQTSTLHFFERSEPRGIRPLGSIPFAERLEAWDLSPDNRLLALAHFPSDTVRVLDLAQNGAELFRIASPKYTGDLAFSPDGRWLAIGGHGLLLVDLVNPDRRAFTAHIENGIDHVRFSPAGNTIFASSYDGRLRVFGWLESNNQIELALRHELKHSKTANVYGFAFTSDGRSVISASGDQTLRTFTGRGEPAPSENRFRDLASWKEFAPGAARPLPAPPETRVAEGHYVPSLLAEPARPTRVQPGIYACKVTTIYKLRDCWVHKDEAGRTLLTFAPDNLLSLSGVLYDDGPVVRYQATLLDNSDLTSCAGCERQPLNGVFRGKGARYEGLLTFRRYFDPHVPPPLPPADAKVEEALDRFPLVLEYRGPLPPSPAEQPVGPQRRMIVP